MRYYLAGPMTGYPQFNFPAFEEAVSTLRAHAYDMISPHEQDSEAVQKEAWASQDGKLHDGKVAGETWGQILARDVEIVADKVQGIVFLPNWKKSRGARLEAFVGLLQGQEFKYWNYVNDEHGFRLMGLSHKEVKDSIYNAT